MRGPLRASHGHCERTYCAVLALCYSLGMDNATTKTAEALESSINDLLAARLADHAAGTGVSDASRAALARMRAARSAYVGRQ